MTAEIKALREAANDLERDLNSIQDGKLQMSATVLAVTVGWLRRRAERIEREIYEKDED